MCNSRLDIAEQQISEPEDTAIQTIQNGAIQYKIRPPPKKKEKKKRKNRTLVNSGTTLRGLIYM